MVKHKMQNNKTVKRKIAKHKMKPKTRFANCKIHPQLFHGLCQCDGSSPGAPTYELCGNCHNLKYSQLENGHNLEYFYDVDC